MEDIVEEGLTLASKLGASYSEIRFHRVESTILKSRNGVMVSVTERTAEGLAVRVLVDGSLGFTSTTRTDRDGVAEAVGEAVSKAKACSPYLRSPVEFSDDRLGSTVYEVKPLKPFDSFSLEDKADLHLDLWKAAVDPLKNRELKTLFSLDYREYLEEKIVANTDGGFTRSRTPRIMLIYNLVLREPSKGSIQRIKEYGGSGGLEWVSKWSLEEVLTGEAERLRKVLLEAVKPPSYPVDVVLGSEIVGLIVHESCGHPMEADRILGREAAQAGLSFIHPESKGRRIGGAQATVVDDPTIPGSFGFYLYDDECVPAKPKTLYNEGVVNEYLHNRWTAKVFGVQSNGSSRAKDYTSEPIVRMSNTYLTAGDYSFEELLEDIRDGVYIASYMEWNIDDERRNQRYVGLEAYRIRRGELCEPVRNPVLEVTTEGFYRSLEAKTKNVKFEAGVCGKGEPAQGVPVWFGGPEVKLKPVKLEAAVG